MPEPVTVEWSTYGDQHGHASVVTADEAESVFRSVDADVEVGAVLVEFPLREVRV